MEDILILASHSHGSESVPAKKSDEGLGSKPKLQIKIQKKKKKSRIGKTPAEKINWSKEEVSLYSMHPDPLHLQDEELRRLVQIYGENSWHRLCKFMPNKTEIRCFKRWIFINDAIRNQESAS